MNKETVLALMDKTVDDGVNRLLVYQSAMTNAVREVIDSPFAGSPKSKAMLKSQLRKIVNSAWVTEERILKEVTGRLNSESPTDLKRVKFMLRQLENVVLNHYNRATLRAVKVNRGEKTFLRYETVARQPIFKMKDVAGKNWSSEWFFRMTYKKLLLDTYNQGIIREMNQEGAEQASVWRPGHSTHGLSFYIGAQKRSKLPTFKDIQSKIFHPNSGALVDKPTIAVDL